MSSDMITVLLVEDDDIDAEGMERAFKKLKISNPLVRARDGQEALDLLRANDNELVGKVVVLLDLNMPRMNGLEFLEIVRSDQALTKLPVFVITSSENQFDIDSAYKSHVSGYIVKPIDRGQLSSLLEKLDAYWAIIKIPELES